MENSESLKNKTDVSKKNLNNSRSCKIQILNKGDRSRCGRSQSVRQINIKFPSDNVTESQNNQPS